MQGVKVAQNTSARPFLSSFSLFLKKFFLRPQALTFSLKVALIHQARSNPLRRGRIMNGLKRFLGASLGKRLVFVAVVALSLVTGCASSQPSPSPYMYGGAGLGAALGAGLGAAINNRNPLKGAAIGGLLGAAGGGVAGEAYGQSKNQQQQQGYYPPPQQQQGYYQPQPPDYGQQQPYYGPPPS
jgi:Glycine zipper